MGQVPFERRERERERERERGLAVVLFKSMVVMVIIPYVKGK